MAQPVVPDILNPDIGGFNTIVDYPGDKCCYIYDFHQFDYWGFREPDDDVDDRRLKLCHDGNRKSFDLAEWGWDNKLSSYYCGKNVWFDFCNDYEGQNCTGQARFNSGAGHLRNHAIRYHNDMMSSAVLGPYDPQQVGAVTLFEDVDCSGGSARYYWNPASLQNGTFYNFEDMKYGGMRDNVVTSVMVPKGYVVELYENLGFHGNYEVIEGAYSDYGSQEMVCQQVSINDAVSSLIVKRQPQGQANAYWQSVTTTESQEISYHVGLSYQDHSRTQWEEAEKMNEALELGLTFLSLFIPSLRLNNQQKDMIKRDVSTTYGYDIGYTTTTSCTVPVGTSGGAGLWQWVVSTEDGATMSFSHHTVCRTGELFNKEPECPYYACANPDCSQCTENWNTTI